MRFVLILLVALVLTVTWQSTVLAGTVTNDTHIIADNTKDSGSKQNTGDDEPECE